MNGAVPWLIWLPLAAAVASFAAGAGRVRRALGLAASAAMLLPAQLVFEAVRRDGPQRYLASWPAPLGIELRADLLSASLLLLTAVVGLVVAAYASTSLGELPPEHAVDPPAAFWPLWFMLSAGLNALYLSTDLFNLYVALEMVTLSAIGLVSLPGTRATIGAALVYLLATLAGSLAFLFGVALLYGAHGTLELFEVGRLLEAGPVTWTALGLMTLGIMVKAAFFPLHFWLPDAHGHALPAVSAVLSGLVVKGGFYLLVRVWFDTFPNVLQPSLGLALGSVALAGVVWASLLALSEGRLKRLLAYSTVAQLGMMLLTVPLAMTGPGGGVGASITPGVEPGLALALSHGLAKAALFLSAGAFIRAAGSDALAELGGVARRLPLTLLASVLAAWTLLGLPPSGGYEAKTLFEQAATAAPIPWQLVVQGGTLLTALYLGVALRAVIEPAAASKRLRAVPLALQIPPLLLAALAVGLGPLPLAWGAS
jgi:multicomponent Na+:H+ antiporter subunit D